MLRVNIRPRKIVTQGNYLQHYLYAVDDETYLMLGEVNNRPSMTVPDMTMPLAEMLKRYVRGQDVQVFEGTYSVDPLLDGVERLDRVGKHDFAREIIERLNASVIRKKVDSVEKVEKVKEVEKPDDSDKTQ